MSFARGYSLWLLPEKKKFRELSELISKLQRQVKEPVFQPHITVISGLSLRESEITGRAEILARDHLPIDIRLNSAVWGYTFFQRYFFDILPKENLINLHKAALQMYGEMEPGDYHPHLSLQYADHTQFPDKNTLANIRLFSGQTVELSELQVMKTNGPIEEWEKTESFKRK